MNTPYLEGTFVCLKTGGPLMTVEETRNDGIVATVWFVGCVCYRDAFHPAHLTALVPEPWDGGSEPLLNETGWKALANLRLKRMEEVIRAIEFWVMARFPEVPPDANDLGAQGQMEVALQMAETTLRNLAKKAT